jgi:glutathione S-transferase
MATLQDHRLTTPMVYDQVESLEICRRELEWVGETFLKDGRKYVMGGDRLSAADITLASLAYPLVSPPQMGSVVRMMIDDGDDGGGDDHDVVARACVRL